MSSEQDQIRALAERIARRLSSSEQGEASSGGDLSALRAGLDQIQQRLTHIESHINHGDSRANDSRAASQTSRAGRENVEPRSHIDENAATPARSLWLSGTYVPATEHPSQERFGIGEAVSEMVDYFEREKTCQLEPGGKPCDHCGMCSTRGF